MIVGSCRKTGVASLRFAISLDPRWFKIILVISAESGENGSLAAFGVEESTVFPVLLPLSSGTLVSPNVVLL